jgi:TRAP transporter 4TM/12TM fusion protein
MSELNGTKAADQQTAVLADAIIEDYPKTIEGKILFSIAILFSTFQLLTAAHIIDLSSQVVRAMHVGFLGLIGLPLISALKNYNFISRTFSWILGILSFAVAVYQMVEYKALIIRAGDPTTMDVIVGVIALTTLFVSSWILMGSSLPIMSGFFLIYCLFGNYLPGIFQHRGYDFKQIIEQMAYGTEGIYGVPIYVSSTYIFLFILFGSFLERAGMIKLFNDVSMGLVGHMTGGPAKVAVISSGMMGTISGSGIANVVTVGQFTIPLMKKFGYKAAFAGGVESTASMGGQIMPPVMGAVAFIMAESLGIKYSEVCIAAIFPALFYYGSAFWMVHLEASKNNLVGLPKDQLPSALKALKEKWYLILPLAVLIYLLFSGYTPLYAGFIGLILTTFLILGSSIALGFSSRTIRFIFWIVLGFIASAFFKLGANIIVATLFILLVWNLFIKGGKKTLLDCRDSLADGAKTALPVGLACAIVGIIIGALTLTGIASTIGQLIIEIGKNSLFLSLVLTMIVCIIVGTGIPTIPTYIITAAIAGPALFKLGIPLLVSHMFVFYFGILADLTPPVALACMAAAPIARESGDKIANESMKIAAAGFVIPFMAVYSPELMLQNASDKSLDMFTLSVIYICIKVTLAIVFWGLAVIGHFKVRLNWTERFLGVIAAALFVPANPWMDKTGFILGIIITFLIWYRIKNISKINS